MLLKGIKALLESHYDVVGSEENGKALIEAALRLKPDLVVLDVSMPILNGIDAAREIKKTLPSTKLVFLTMQTNAIYLRKALEAGASGYVLKSGAAEELLTGIEEARKGNVYVTPDFGQDVIDKLRDWGDRPGEVPGGVDRPAETDSSTSRRRQAEQRNCRNSTYFSEDGGISPEPSHDETRRTQRRGTHQVRHPGRSDRRPGDNPSTLNGLPRP